MQTYSQKFEFNMSITDKITNNLPPTSAQSFLRENLTFPAVVLSSNPQNRFYHSIFDDQNNIEFKYYNTSQDFTTIAERNDKSDFPDSSIQLAIRNVSTVLAAAIYEIITGSPYSADKTTNPVMVSERNENVKGNAKQTFYVVIVTDWRIAVLFSDIVRVSVIESCRSKESTGSTRCSASTKVIKFRTSRRPQ